MAAGSRPWLVQEASIEVESTRVQQGLNRPGGEIRRGFSRILWGHRGGLDNGPFGLKQEFVGQEQFQAQPVGVDVANNNNNNK